MNLLNQMMILVIFLGVAFPGSSQTPTPKPCLERGGRIEKSNLRSSLLKLPMEYRVYLPPCYEEQTDQRYPVLYLFHGSNNNDDQWDRLGVDETANRMIAAGEIPPFIIVMPRDRNWSDPPVDLFGRVIIEELIPLIDRAYRTLPSREQRSVGGLSRGAGWAVNLGLSHPELFGALGAHSLPVFWSDIGNIRVWLAKIPASDLPRIYLDIGDHDRPPIMASAVWFEKLLTQLGVPHEWYLFPGYHDESYWSRHLDQYLRWYSANW